MGGGVETLQKDDLLSGRTQQGKQDFFSFQQNELGAIIL